MKKPVKPTKPKIPVMPETHIRKVVTTSIDDGDDMSCYHGPDVLSAKVRVEHYGDSYIDSSYYLDITYNEYIENPNYDKLYKKYQKDLEKYDADIKKYEDAMILYKLADKEWKKFQKIQKQYNDLLKMAESDPEKMKQFVAKFNGDLT